ncbi:hypothetical protein CEXT_332031 [Caerostris extrusa]|uniref:Uncharacterized protein n=1 Tax=Caerostris extrusa TaxID=172846 RepID=A0AAV4RMW5_CAEEX|nr:hypothetical protein CEXT_332031 [Caerostris extrusa]
MHSRKIFLLISESDGRWGGYEEGVLKNWEKEGGGRKKVKQKNLCLESRRPEFANSAAAAAFAPRTPHPQSIKPHPVQRS